LSSFLNFFISHIWPIRSNNKPAAPSQSIGPNPSFRGKFEVLTWWLNYIELKLARSGNLAYLIKTIFS
jgi:hypothetical protein